MAATTDTESSEVQLLQAREILRRYCQGLTARNVQVHSTKSLTEKGIGWTSIEKPATEGTSIYLPPLVDEFATKEHNFLHFKVLATHQAAHLEFGTFDFNMSKASTLFANAKFELQAKSRGSESVLSDFQRFFDMFEDRGLASDIFMVVEDTRVDYLLKCEYQGIRASYERAQLNSLEKRPDITSLPQREALLEILIQLSIESWGFFPVPRGQSKKLATAAAILRRVRNRRATVEDSAEATIRIYSLLSSTANAFQKPGSSQDHTNPLEGPSPSLEDDLEKTLSEFAGQSEGQSRDGNSDLQDDRPYRGPQDVDYRGGVKPELVQALGNVRRSSQGNDQRSAQKPSVEALQQLYEKSTEIESKDPSQTNPSDSLQFAGNVMKSQGTRNDAAKDAEKRRVVHVSGPSGSIPPVPGRDGGPYLYDEWDFVSADYKRRWCHLRQRSVEESSVAFYTNTVKNRASLVTAVRREFERLRAARLKKVRRLQDGEELDFDAVIESMIEKRAGVTPNEKVYWRKNKVERDVCVVFLLDMSASTYESVSGGYRLSAGNSGDDGSKRIIDIEKESIVVLVEALDAIGDTYGVYGFSGHGKNSVEYYVIKDIAEEMSAKIKRRIESVAPAQETRMGTAIRHSISILDRQEHKTKVLLLLSDGRPQDHDYGAHHFKSLRSTSAILGGDPLGPPTNYSPDHLMKDYAVHDTRMALLEAKNKGIVPFCLTVDKRGHDYLKAMCGDIGYEVIDDITTLPKRLPSLYRRLTT